MAEWKAAAGILTLGGTDITICRNNDWSNYEFAVHVPYRETAQFNRLVLAKNYGERCANENKRPAPVDSKLKTKLFSKVRQTFSWTTKKASQVSPERPIPQL